MQIRTVATDRDVRAPPPRAHCRRSSSSVHSLRRALSIAALITIDCGCPRAGRAPRAASLRGRVRSLLWSGLSWWDVALAAAVARLRGRAQGPLREKARPGTASARSLSAWIDRLRRRRSCSCSWSTRRASARATWSPGSRPAPSASPAGRDSTPLLGLVFGPDGDAPPALAARHARVLRGGAVDAAALPPAELREGGGPGDSGPRWSRTRSRLGELPPDLGDPGNLRAALLATGATAGDHCRPGRAQRPAAGPSWRRAATAASP